MVDFCLMVLLSGVVSTNPANNVVQVNNVFYSYEKGKPVYYLPNATNSHKILCPSKQKFAKGPSDMSNLIKSVE